MVIKDASMLMIIFTGGIGGVLLIWGLFLLIKPVKDEIAARKPGEMYKDVVKRTRDSGRGAFFMGLIVILLGLAYDKGYVFYFLPW